MESAKIPVKFLLNFYLKIIKDKKCQIFQKTLKNLKNLKNYKKNSRNKKKKIFFKAQKSGKNQFKPLHKIVAEGKTFRNDNVLIHSYFSAIHLHKRRVERL